MIKRELSSNLKEKSNQEDEISNSQYEKLFVSLIDNNDSTLIFFRKHERLIVNFKKMTSRKNQNQLSTFAIWETGPDSSLCSYRKT